MGEARGRESYRVGGRIYFDKALGGALWITKS